VPPNHWLLVQDTAPFRATLKLKKLLRFTFNPSRFVMATLPVSPHKNCSGCRIDFGALRRHFTKSLGDNPLSRARAATFNLQPSTFNFGFVDQWHRRDGAHLH